MLSFLCSLLGLVSCDKRTSFSSSRDVRAVLMGQFHNGLEWKSTGRFRAGMIVTLLQVDIDWLDCFSTVRDKLFLIIPTSH